VRWIADATLDSAAMAFTYVNLSGDLLAVERFDQRVEQKGKAPLEPSACR
jgi:hypothetical protein